MSERKQPVLWSLEEETKIAACAAEFLVAEGLTSEPPAGKSRESKVWLDAVRRAQSEMLHESRHKALQSRHNLPDGFSRKVALQLGIATRKHACSELAPTATNAQELSKPVSMPEPALSSISDSDLVKELVTRLAGYASKFRDTLESIDRAVNRVNQLECSVAELKQYQELVTDELSELRTAVKAVAPAPKA